jgi:hypothetical protein
LPLTTDVGSSTHIAVIAWRSVVRELTSGARITGIIRAGVVVRTECGRAGSTGAVGADVTYGTGISVKTGQSLVVGNQAASARARFAGRCQADGIGAGRDGRALDDGGWIHFALVRQLVQITDQSSIAQVRVFKRGTVDVALAIARDCHTGADSLFALIGHGAGITVVTPGSVVGKGTTAQTVAAILGTRVVVVTVNRRADANAGITVVTYRTDVPVATLAVQQRGVLAPVCAGTDVFGAGVAVIADMDVTVVDQHRFVDFTIAVVVLAVADFHAGE